MWGMAGWSNSNDDESLGSLQAAVEHGCNFFDTAYAYDRSVQPRHASLHSFKDSAERSEVAGAT
jgi:aryl-alcohol dehydrogenase-like predicted oxidoreductase